MSTQRTRNLQLGILFPNQAAFVDRVVLSNWGEMSEHFEAGLKHGRNKGILTPRSLYSHCIFGTSPLTDNPIRVEYGKTKQFANIPDQRITIFTRKRPITAAETRILVASLKDGDSKIHLSLVELTFDVTGFGVLQFRRQLLYRARATRMVKDHRGSRTLYVGTPSSAWQVRVYDKSESVVRLEFIFYRSFLSRHGINDPDRVLLLRKFKMWDLLSVRQFSRVRVAKATKSWDADARRLVTRWNKRTQGLQRLARMLRRKRVNPAAVLRKAPVQRKFESMQRRLIW